MGRLFRPGPAWYTEGSNRSFVAYLRCVRRQPAFGTMVAGAVCFAVAGYLKSHDLAIDGIGLGVIVAASVVGYLIWRRIVRSERALDWTRVGYPCGISAVTRVIRQASTSIMEARMEVPVQRVGAREMTI